MKLFVLLAVGLAFASPGVIAYEYCDCPTDHDRAQPPPRGGGSSDTSGSDSTTAFGPAGTWAQASARWTSHADNYRGMSYGHACSSDSQQCYAFNGCTESACAGYDSTTLSYHDTGNNADATAQVKS